MLSAVRYDCSASFFFKCGIAQQMLLMNILSHYSNISFRYNDRMINYTLLFGPVCVQCTQIHTVRTTAACDNSDIVDNLYVDQI
jgi:hypothetical protein